jgi:hypothetical protein
VDAVGGDEDHPDETSAQSAGSRPKYYCHLHNGDPERYPIDPIQTLNDDFYWDGVMRDDAYYESLQETPDDGTAPPFEIFPNFNTNTDGTGPFPNPTPVQPGQTTAPQEQPPPSQTPPGQAPTEQQGQGAPQEESTRPSWLPPLQQ